VLGRHMQESVRISLKRMCSPQTVFRHLEDKQQQGTTHGAGRMTNEVPATMKFLKPLL
jgi:hypothetical protein